VLGKSVYIMFSGKAGVGKTTSGNLLKKYLESKRYSVFIAPFALRLKQVAKASFGWDGEKNERGRKLLQEIGKVGRGYNENLWVDWQLENLIPSNAGYPFDFVIVDDWRFPNEEYRARKNFLYSVYTVRIEAPELEILKGRPEYDDVSEISLDDKLDFDYVIKNNGSIELLEQRLKEVVTNILSKEKVFGGK
jgi:hypothetical protein